MTSPGRGGSRSCGLACLRIQVQTWHETVTFRVVHIASHSRSNFGCGGATGTPWPGQTLSLLFREGGGERR